MGKIFLLLLFSLLFSTSYSQTKWYKGNLHTHSFWSDGDDYPESIINWYKENGYNFIAISDHNVLAEGEKWIEVDSSLSSQEAFAKYISLFDSSWVEMKNDSAAGKKIFVRLKTFDEYVPLFEEPGNFLIIKSEEITDKFQNKPIHINATNVVELIPPQGGNSVAEVLQNNIDAVLEQRKRTGQDMFPHINHPYFGWALTAEDIIAVEGEKFFEVYNGHPLVHNEGDSLHPNTDKLWDIILSEKLLNGKDIIYGIAVDDAHNYHEYHLKKSNPGRGWIMVESEELSIGSIISAMEEGRFYASTGVEIKNINIEDDKFKIEIVYEEGVTYTTQFIGTRKGYNKSNEIYSGGNNSPITKNYSDDIGAIFKEDKGIFPEYNFTGDEIYVRVKIVSSKLKVNPYKEGEKETAWVQPIIVK